MQPPPAKLLSREVHARLREAWAGPLKAAGWKRSKLSPSAWSLADGDDSVSFWVQIDKDTQLERFTERQNTPEKQWKITDEDWRNRDKWDQYEEAVNEMLRKTSTEYAPWHILESVDKKYARIKALKIVIAELEKALG